MRERLFMVMIGGIMRLIVVTGGVRKLVQFLRRKKMISSPIKVGPAFTGDGGDIVNLYREFDKPADCRRINEKTLPGAGKVSPEKMSYIIQTCVSVCSSVMINGWGAAMMGAIGVQIAQGYLTGEPSEVLALRWSGIRWSGFH